MRPCSQCGEILPRDIEECPACGHREHDAPRVEEKPVAGEEQRRLEEERMKEVSKVEVRVMDILLTVVPLAIPVAGGFVGYSFGGVEGMVWGIVLGLIVMTVIRRF